MESEQGTSASNNDATEDRLSPPVTEHDESNTPDPAAPEASAADAPPSGAAPDKPFAGPGTTYPPPSFVPPAKPIGTFRKGFGWGTGIGAGLAVVVTALSVLSAISMVVGLVAMAALSSTQSTGTRIWGQGSNTLRAISIEGTIMADGASGGLLSSGTYGYQVAAEIDEMTKESASGLVLLVNTPGGSISGSKAIADAVDRYRERTGHKVLVHISEMSASGGVYATSTADEIIADQGTLIGSIGVIMGPLMQYQGVTEVGSTLIEAGVTAESIEGQYITAGTGKDFGNPYRAITDAERAHYQAGIDAEYARFVTQVSTHRPITEDAIRNELGAYMFDPQAAKANGLIDDVMSREDFFRHAAEASGLDPNDTVVEAAVQGGGLLSLLGAREVHPVGFAAAVEQGAGITPAVNQAVCSGTQPLAYAGSLRSICG